MWWSRKKRNRKKEEEKKIKPRTYFIYTLSTQTKVKIPYINLIIASGTVYPRDGGTVLCRQLYFYSWNYTICIYIYRVIDLFGKYLYIFFSCSKIHKRTKTIRHLRSHCCAVSYRFLYFFSSTFWKWATTVSSNYVLLADFYSDSDTGYDGNYSKHVWRWFFFCKSLGLWQRIGWRWTSKWEKRLWSSKMTKTSSEFGMSSDPRSSVDGPNERRTVGTCTTAFMRFWHMICGDEKNPR